MSGDTPWYVRAFDAEYLEVYAHRDATEAERVTARLLEPLQLTGQRVLDLACGAGRYSAALGRRDARVVGLDLSLPLLRQARAAVPGARGFVRSHMGALPFAAASFDLALCMFTSFGYLPTAAEDRAVLGEIRRVLGASGALVLDLLNAASVRRSLPGESERRAGNLQVRERRWLEADDVVVKAVELERGGRVRRYEERVRLWPLDALVAALAAAALPVRRMWGSYAGEPFVASTSPRLILLAGADRPGC
ncbi:MAG TPA: class I SAM-dependent methyltransferase [Candidatus Krumholzibacteria bacterium]|nr:class I SAM-dependent methyltransferase [Candidatus Krumholzibacteria bacterium]